MLVQPIQLHKKNKLIQEYRKEQNFVTDYFAYKPFSEVDKRFADLQEESYERQQLAQILKTMNEQWDAPRSTIEQIERLKDESSVVVIGGQQAGLLTGPLYSLNKIISVYRYAKEQEEHLGVPVIPVFWIAGEDHDYDEINHIYSLRDTRVLKHTTKQQVLIKKSVSHLQLDKEKTSKWLREAFLDLQETIHTKNLYEKMNQCLEESNTFVEFFARVMFTMFENEGVVFVDSANEELRKFESTHFVTLIKENEAIANDVYKTVQNLQQSGYEIPLDVERHDAHLFYHDEVGERILLNRIDGKYVDKNGEVSLTEAELIRIAKENPEKLSNNVITRPLMQEMIFPTLAFIAGDGEITYWAALKNSFQQIGKKIPPVLPRLSFTYVSKRMEKLLDQRVVSLEDVIRHGIATRKVNWFASQQQQPVDRLFSEVQNQIESIHAPLQEMAASIAPDLHEASKTNVQLILDQLTYLQRKTEQALASQYEDVLLQFDELEVNLHPNNGLQERVYSPLPLLNVYGFDWVKQLNELEDLSFSEDHYAIFIQT